MKDFKKGAFFRSYSKNSVGTLVSSGSEVSLALETKELLKEEGIIVNVVEMVSTNLFDKTDDDYKDKLIPKDKPSMFIEMNSPYGLKTYTDYVYGIETFGKSGNIKDVLKYFGFEKEKVASFFKKVLK